jgi:hypothetical protein
MEIREKIDVDVRFSFTWAFVAGAFQLAKRAQLIEATNAEELTEALKREHRAYVVGAVMQATAALEAEISDVVSHGPGHHLGDEHVDSLSRSFLKPLVDVIDRQPALERYELVLHLLKRPSLDRGQEPWASTSVLLKLRNEIVHYKSRWESELMGKKFWNTVRNLRLQPPPFVDANSLYFPHQCLSAACAAWSARCALNFIDAFYERLGIDSPLDPHRAYLTT